MFLDKSIGRLHVLFLSGAVLPRRLGGVCHAQESREVQRSAGVIGTAVMAARIATGEINEHTREPSGKVRSGLAGARARAENMTKEERSAVARKAAGARWG